LTTIRRIALAGVLGFVFGSSALAEAYPDHVVRIVVPFSAGSITDGFARILAEKLGVMWKQQVIVENRPGIPGTNSVATAPADGYTLMVTSNGHVVSKVINKDVPFDPVKDFAGVTKIASVPQLLVIPPELPVNTLPEFIALAKRKPHTLNYSSSGIGSNNNLCFALLIQAANIDVVHVPYKGGPEAFTAVIRNDVQMTLAPYTLVQQMLEAKKVRVIAVNYPTRTPQMPNLPTATETLPNYECDAWFGMLAPSATPRAIIDKVSKDVKTALAMPDVVTKLQAYGAVPSPTTPAELDAQLKAETALYSKVLHAAGVVAK
jgi:tripartite-type tricarboxylate transporter receptor subunit TctC